MYRDRKSNGNISKAEVYFLWLLVEQTSQKSKAKEISPANILFHLRDS